MTGDHGSACAISRAIPSLALHGSAGLSVFNHRTAMQTLPPYALLTLSSELSRDEIGILIALAAPNEHPPVFSLIVQGNSEAMITEDCLPRIARHCHPVNNAAPEQRGTAFLGIQDETGRVFPVRSDGSCRTRISNASELCLIDMLPAIREAGITAVAIDVRNRPPAYTRRIIEIYQNAILQVETGTGKARDTALMELKDQVKKIALGGITAGHFIRGLRE
jgi:putative protease